MFGENGELFDLSLYKEQEGKGNEATSEVEEAVERLDDIERRLLKNLESKVHRNEKLTVADYKMLADLNRKLSSRKEEILPEHFVPNAEEVAKFVGRSVRTIRNWTNEGMPQLPHGYDLFAIQEWGIKEGKIKKSKIGVEPNEENEGSGSMDRAHYETEIKRLDSELKAIKLQKEAGALISREDVEKEWTARAFEFKRDLLAMARRLSLKGANKEPPILYEIIREDAVQILEKYARGRVNLNALEASNDC